MKNRNLMKRGSFTLSEAQSVHEHRRSTGASQKNLAFGRICGALLFVAICSPLMARADVVSFTGKSSCDVAPNKVEIVFDPSVPDGKAQISASIGGLEVIVKDPVVSRASNQSYLLGPRVCNDCVGLMVDKDLKMVSGNIGFIKGLMKATGRIVSPSNAIHNAPSGMWAGEGFFFSAGKVAAFSLTGGGLTPENATRCLEFSGGTTIK